MKFPRSFARLWLAAVCCLTLLVVASAEGAVTINEIYYDPPDNTTPTEYIELYNTGAAAVDLSGWNFDTGVTYTFPGGSSIAANGYVVVAQDVTAFQAAFGFTPYGPFAGKLSNSGEQLRLRDAAGNKVSEVNYGAGFPWPTAARGLGSSIELINPTFDGSVPGNWRASGQPVAYAPQQTFVPPVSTTWRYRKGVSEPSTGVGAWRQIGFTEDSTWMTGQTSVGYGDSDDNTILTDMQNAYSSLYLRKTFSVAAGQKPDTLILRVRVDDGCVVWINGTEVARFHVPDGQLNYNSFANDHEADVVNFEEVTLANASSYLVEGTNVLAIHALNATIGSSDFSIDAQLLSSPVSANTAPTPGKVNSTLSAAALPNIDTVAHTPVSPASGQAVTITARVAGASGVTLQYQTVDPGSYIRKTDAAYATGWTSLAMNDTGTGGDAVAGDGIYSAIIPATVQTHRRLVRYRISTTNAAGKIVQVPFADDEQPNFAYFVYNGYPNWTGALDPGVTAAQTFQVSALPALPTYQLIANVTDVINSQFVSSYDGVYLWGTLVYNGKVFDHVQFKNRGEYSTYNTGKNKWRVHFNTARELQALDSWGKPYPQTWDTLNLNNCASPWAALHRGMCGVEEAVAFRLQALAGVPASRTQFIHWRVIDDASETTTNGSQYTGGDPVGSNGGDLWGVYSIIEPIDGSFLDSRDLPDGNVYKIESNYGDKKHQGATQPSDDSDSVAFRAASNGTPTEAWWRANMDLPTFYSFMAVNRAIGNVDLFETQNHAFYHHPDGHWVPLPWDQDMLFIAKKHQSGIILQNKCLSIAGIAGEYRNRCREFLDLALADASVTGGQIGQMIDEYSQMVNPAGAALTWADLDAAMWNKNPRAPATSTANNNHYGNFYKTPYTDVRYGGNWTRYLTTADHEGHMKYLTEYATNTFPTGQTWAVNNGIQYGYGYKFVESEAADASVPNRPTITYKGAAGYPLNDLRFSSSAYSSPIGVTSFASIQYRIGEIGAPGIPLFDATGPRIYELTDVWRSAELTAATGETRVPGANLKVGHTYRVRARHKDTSNRWSRWSEASQFVVGNAVVAPYQQALAITEIMYNPPVATAAETAAGYTTQDFEYIEFKNIGTDPLDLSAVSITAGVVFTFPSMTLAPGAYTLAVKNMGAFTMRYGSLRPVAGAFTSGNLDNGGEIVTVSLGATDTIRSFAYSDGSHPATGQTIDPWPTQADGGGYSLVVIHPTATTDLSVAANWRLSVLPGGSPGMDDTLTYTSWSAMYPTAGGATANPDGDAYANLIEYAMGANPLTYTSGDALVGSAKTLTVNSVTEPYLTYTLRRAIGATDVTCHVEFSADLATWAENGALVSATPTGDGTITEIWRASTPMSVATSPRFVRLRVSQP